MARIILNNNRTPAAAAAAAAANDRACVRRMKYRRNDPRGIRGGPGAVRSKSKIGRTGGLRDTASRMKFRERYANQTASIRRSGVAAAALSRSANLPGRGFRSGPPSPQRDPPAVLAADSEEANAARNLQVRRKHDVHERAAEKRREREEEEEKKRDSARVRDEDEEERRDGGIQ